MYSHAPENYTCSFCCLIQNIECAGNQLVQSDIVIQKEIVTAFVALMRWSQNPGHVLIAPNEHYENIYDLPLKIGAEIHALAREIALAMKAAYRCDVILIRQHNEPAGGQRMFHYHLHVIPRYTSDNYDTSQKDPFPVGERANFARHLKAALKNV